MRNRNSKTDSPSPATSSSTAPAEPWQSHSPPSSLPPIRTIRTSGSAPAWQAEAVSPVGRMFLQEELPVHVVCAMGCRERLETDRLREGLRDTLLRHPRFTSRVDFTSPHKPQWTPCEVDLHRHVQEVRLGGEGERGTEEGEREGEGEKVTEREAERQTPLEEFVSKLGMEPPMDNSYPLWRAYVVNWREREAEGHLIFRIHHSLGDGISLMSLLLACTRQLDHPHLLPTIPGTFYHKNGKTHIENGKIGLLNDKIDSGNDKNELKTDFEEVKNCEKEDEIEVENDRSSNGNGNGFSTSSVQNGSPHTPSLSSLNVLEKQKIPFSLSVLKGIEFVVNTVVHYFQFLGLVIAFKDSDSQVKGGKGVEKGKYSMSVSDEISLADVALVRRASGGSTVTDVMMATVSGGLRLYMLEKDESSSKEDSGKVHPDKAIVRSLTLVNLRPSPGLQELSTMMATGSKVKWGNEVGYFLVPLPVGKFSHPLDRVKKMRKVLLKKKNSFEAAISHINGVLVTNLLGSKAVAQLSYRASSRTTVSTSSLVGPRERVTLGGVEVMYVAATVTGTPQSLIIHILSYKESLRICIWASREVIPEPSKLCRCFLTAFEELKKSAEA